MTQVLLGRRGYVTALRIGVARSELGRFEAHAWIECESEVVIGNSRDLERYALFSDLDRVVSNS